MPDLKRKPFGKERTIWVETRKRRCSLKCGLATIPPLLICKAWNIILRPNGCRSAPHFMSIRLRYLSIKVHFGKRLRFLVGNSRKVHKTAPGSKK